MNTQVKYMCSRMKRGRNRIWRVTPRDKSLIKERQDLYNHSPNGFEFGYGGSGPAQSALAILADFLKDDRAAIILHQAFKARVIAATQDDMFIVTGDQIVEVIAEIKQDYPEVDRQLEEIHNRSELTPPNGVHDEEQTNRSS